MSASTTILPVILSGGAGSRLWPLSRRAAPKQLLALVGDRTMVEATAARFDAPGYLPPAFICNADHADTIDAQVPAKNGESGSLILEPVGRNTAPCAAVAALHAREIGADLVLMSPADHHVTDPESFRDAVAAARGAALDGHIVTFGITPTGPETGYGYIRRGGGLGGRVARVDSFVEKPDRATAQGYLDAGGYSWNAGLFLFAPDAMIAELERHAPAILAAARAAYDRASRSGRRLALDADSFAASPSEAVDRAVMERTDRAAVVDVSMGWNDIGAFDALHRVRADAGGADAHGNVAPEGTIAMEAGGCLVDSDGPRVSLVGVENVGVVVRGGEVLVVALDRAQGVKAVVDAIKAGGDTGRL